MLALKNTLNQIRAVFDTTNIIDKLYNGTLTSTDQIPQGIYGLVTKLYMSQFRCYDTSKKELNQNECKTHTDSLFLAISEAFLSAKNKENLDLIKQDAQIKHYNRIRSSIPPTVQYQNVWNKTIDLLCGEIFDRVVTALTREKLIAYLSTDNLKSTITLVNPMNEISELITKNVNETQLKIDDQNTVIFIEKLIQASLDLSKDDAQKHITKAQRLVYAVILQKLSQRVFEFKTLTLDSDIIRECQLHLFGLQDEIVNMDKIINKNQVTFFKELLLIIYKAIVDKIITQQ